MKKLLQSKIFVITLSVVWFALTAIPIGIMMGQHQAFKVNTNTASLVKFNKSLDKKYSVIHLIGSDCLCSVKVSEHLIRRKPLKGIEELVIVVGQNKKLLQNFKAVGFKVEEISEETAENTYSIKALPQMIIYGKQNQALYSGGYSTKRTPASTEDYEDLKIIKLVTHGQTQNERPVFGCANGSNFKKNIDPIGIKY